MEKRIVDALVGSARVLRAVDTGTWSVREANIHLKESRAVLRQIKKELLAKRRKGPAAMRTVKLKPVPGPLCDSAAVGSAGDHTHICKLATHKTALHLCRCGMIFVATPKKKLDEVVEQKQQ